MYLTQIAVKSQPKQELDSGCNQLQAVTNDNILEHSELKEHIEGEQQWLQEQAYQHDRYLYADRI
ncbi:MAG: hypothetical protein N4J56_004500 [Chroococcidiopsis sp. SAG 2025]|uniref:hypothetical protein n=1 Tax=Chroococcidiopsis sp. SAG 2025 TaxID=171389 RepID=UPI00293713BC|nr:hypothetical protein [Chroococcidiopsis sp. SAG 2025]MDV2994846.1 hypothetical protein [Chroococcidiopsis sp. SAG 2025]